MRTFCAIALPVFLALAPGVAAATSLTDNLVASYPLDGSANNTVSAAGQGTLINSPTFGTDRAGTPGRALSLNGNNQYASMGALGVTGVGDFTVSAWFKVVAYGPTRLYVLDMRYPGSDEIPALLIDTSGPNANLDFYSGYAEVHHLVGDIRGQWHQMAVVRQGSSQINYFDGAQVGSATTISTATQTWNGADWRLGNFYAQNTPGGEYWLNGSIDDVALWTRALSSAEMTQYYQSGLSPVPEPATAALLPLAAAALAAHARRRASKLR